MRASIFRAKAISTILLSSVAVLGAVVAQAEEVAVQTGHPESSVTVGAAGQRPVVAIDSSLIRSSDRPIEKREVIVDSSVDPDLVRIDAGSEPPFDIGHYA